MKISGLFKSIFSRIFLVALAVITQVILLVFFTFELTTKYVYLQIISSIIGIVVFVIVINKKIHPEHKLMWTFLILLFPIFGITLFLLLDINKPSKRHLKKYIDFDLNEIKKEKDYKQDVYMISNDYSGQLKYLENVSKLNAYKNTQITYLSGGTNFYNSLIKDLKNANKFIFMEYFIIKHGKMWNSILEILKDKASKGVQVKLIYDDVGSANYLKANYYKKLRELGIECVKFNKMIPLVSSYHNNRDHRKITIIDGYIGYTGGINIGDEYINVDSPYGYWKDNAIRLEGEAVDNLSILFLQSFSLASRKKQNLGQYLYQNNSIKQIVSNEIVIPFGTGPSNIYYENMAVDVIINLISQAKVSIDITTPYLIIDYSLTNALIAAKEKGVKVRILIPGMPDKKIIYAFGKQHALNLLKHGIEIYSYTPGFNHAKSILIDDALAYVGTTNLDFRSLIHHYECGALIYNSICVKDIDANFESDYLKSKKLSEQDLKTSWITKIFVSFMKIFQSLL